MKHYETKFSFARGLGIFAWLSAYVFALRFNILKMYELYAALHPSRPIATSPPPPRMDIHASSARKR
ncbi:MAG: hypothetical protein IPG80_21375 [Anaerolineales bacterium]|uniref:hypothetical protein n=1 Tax=Candidatus Villigracilis vicinus TaxID=3140679 RepID=UPI00313493B0|nr:hypothetical protein [Anaerolineales bacterium]